MSLDLIGLKERKAVLLLRQLIEKQDDKIIINDSMYWRNCFVAGVYHEARYLLVLSAAYFPAYTYLLHLNAEKYPVKQLVESLKDKWGDAWMDRYRPPERLKIDVLDECVAESVNALNDTLEALNRTLDCRCVCGNWESDFARTRYLVTPIEGDKAFLREMAISALEEARVQVSASAERLLARDEIALVSMGMATVTLEKINPYSSYLDYSADREEREKGLSFSYT
jgi:hypothetical protein